MATASIDFRTHNACQKDLIDLDKSHETFADQIDKASRILGINVDVGYPLQNVPHGVRSAEPISFTGREEWVLRWLLSKLQTPDESRSSPKCEPRAWVLLGSLLPLIPLSKVARLLSAHSFMQILNESFRLTVSAASARADAVAISNSLNQSAEACSSTNTSETSATMRTSSMSPPNGVPRKRKRSGTLIAVHSSREAVSRKVTGEDAILLSIVRAVQIIDELCHSGEADDFSCQYMKATLRTSPDLAAQVLGNALRATGALLDQPFKQVSEDESLNRLAGIMAIVSIWHARSIGADDVAGHQSNVMFSAHCLVPVATVLCRWRSMPKLSPAVEELICSLEQLIAQHVLIPARSKTSVSSRVTIANRGGGLNLKEPPSIHQLADCLDPLRREVLSLSSKTSLSTGESWRLSAIYQAIPILFELAIRCIPDDKNQGRVVEKPFLEAFFTALAQSVAIPMSASAPLELPYDTRNILEHMLKIALERNVIFSQSFLTKILDFSGLIQRKQGTVHWAMISSILKLDSSVLFLAKDESKQGAVFLETLLERITASAYVENGSLSEHYEIIKREIIPLLLRESALSRNLDSFINDWKMELSRFEKSRCEPWQGRPPFAYNTSSIWEDSDLLSHCRRLLQTSLTMTQMVHLLASLLSDLEIESTKTANTDHLGTTRASLALLNITIDSIEQEEAVEALRGSIFPVYNTVLEIIATHSETLSVQQWRLWKILTQIHGHLVRMGLQTDQYVGRTDPTDLKFQRLQLAIARAQAIITQLPLGATMDENYPAKAQTAGEAFEFLCSLMHSLPAQGNTMNDRVKRALQASMGAIHEAVLLNLSGARDSIKTLCSERSLTFRSALALLRFPSIIAHLFPRERENFMLDIYRIAHWQDSLHHNQRLPISGVSFRNIWEAFLDTDSLWQESSIRDDLPESLDRDELRLLLDLYYSLILPDLNSLLKNQEQTPPFESNAELRVLLQGVAGISTFPGEGPHIDTVIGTLRRMLLDANIFLDDGSRRPRPQRKSSDNLSSLVMAYDVVAFHKDTTDLSFYISSGSLLLQQDLTTAEEHMILIAFKRFSRTLDTTGKATTLATLVGNTTEVVAGPSQLLLLNTFLRCLGDTEMRSPQLRTILPLTFSKICRALPKARNFFELSLIANCLSFAVLEKSWPMTQWDIDCMLDSLLVAASTSGPQLEAHTSGSTFLSLCDLLGAILAVRRTKLGGRFHLVTALLQSLLRCLFVADSVRRTKPPSCSAPPWLASSSSTLVATHATAYSRLLCSLCDPTVSSVADPHRRSNQELNDETKKARMAAGRYLPYILMEYTRCQLDGRLPPDSKDALTPGLYAVLDVVTPDALRALNASMDASSRAIFRRLYEDYRHFGKWQQD
ncbi:MAG: hypothetical protein M1819_002582 [Sarea resinae]|nr:MAG: hypothetical protein M1819_002582 [Sarea resinae]